MSAALISSFKMSLSLISAYLLDKPDQEGLIGIDKHMVLSTWPHAHLGRVKLHNLF